MVEFALVFPLLLILLLGLADFGRVFAAGITIEAAARNGAEAASQEYLQMVRDGVAVDYTHIHQVAVNEVCRETSILANNFGGTCSAWTVVCVHDGMSPSCGAEQASPPSADAVTNCTNIGDAWSHAIQGGATTPLPYVEVRVCYKFTTLFNLTGLRLPFGQSLSLGNVWLQRDREFTVADY